MPKATLILPSLNVGGYIEECLESVRCQSLEDIEILCIDAGSTDGTYEILREHAAADSRIRLIRSQVRSYGYQVNLGFSMARGEYVGIVETDDSIEPDMYETLCRVATEEGLDYAKGGFYTMATPCEGERYLLEHPLPDTGRLLSHTYYTDSPLSPDVYIWNGVYRREFLERNRIRLNESPGAAFQDCGLRYLTDMNLERGMFIDRLLYRYRRDNAASSTYDPRFARFNLQECRYIRARMDEQGMRDRARRAFMARESVMMALSPYMTYREHSRPDEAIRRDMEEMREMICRDREAGLLARREMHPDLYLEMRLFTENPEAYEAYAGIRAGINSSIYGDFVREMKEKEQIVLCCAGKAAKFALCLMRMNGLGNIACVCDNNSALWGGTYHGWEVVGLQEAVHRYPKAHYLVTNRACPEEILKQLKGYGIREKAMSAYTLPLQAFGSTNLFMRDMD
ncbi:MAG: glycosyltransferase [Lachnospiraceae bacterium]|jgi:glycosyltransferase involved in cell wall biosynthesis|nr:glycosyltransferase [Lachnospiraceae bacterium]